MSEMRVVKIADISVIAPALAAFYKTAAEAIEKHGEENAKNKLGAYITSLMMMEKQAMDSIANPYFVPTPENVAVHYDYMTGVGFAMIMAPLLKEEILIAAVESADVAPWFRESIAKPAVDHQPLWPTLLRHLMIEQIQAIYFAKALIEELHVRVPEFLEAA